MEVRSIGSNQIEVRKSNGQFLVSYETPVAAYINSIGYVRSEDFFSVTTSKHINRWLEGVKAQKVPQVVIKKHFDLGA